jgi:hypothetical protein
MEVSDNFDELIALTEKSRSDAIKQEDIDFLNYVKKKVEDINCPSYLIDYNQKMYLSNVFSISARKRKILDLRVKKLCTERDWKRSLGKDGKSQSYDQVFDEVNKLLFNEEERLAEYSDNVKKFQETVSSN